MIYPLLDKNKDVLEHEVKLKASKVTVVFFVDITVTGDIWQKHAETISVLARLPGFQVAVSYKDDLPAVFHHGRVAENMSKPVVAKCRFQ